MSTLTVTLCTRTPVYTGGVDGTMNRIHETGIIGSLRWWYEAIVRGLGGWACDPVSDGRCPDRDGNYCDVCAVFGATGWRRRFRLEVEDNTQPIWSPPAKMLNIRPPGRKRGWYLPPGKMGELTLRFIGEPRVLSLMASMLLFLEKWGNLGAKPQLGYGVFSIENHDKVQKWAEKWQWKVLGSQQPSGNLPDLRRFGFFQFRFSPSQPGWWTKVPGLTYVARHVQPLVSRHQVVPVSPALKNEWRFHQWQKSWGDARDVFGTLRPDRKRSRVVVSWAYAQGDSWEVRGWVWLPPQPLTAKHLWSLLADQQIWAQVIHSGSLHPKEPVSTPQELVQFLEEGR
ncbi:MAG: type III-B CRISPR module RAMP protein Cmr1 [Ardenticatenia bacterium]|nr:type III-B CRISPR module RAMP protein Cmr1 [Ardenticatenia bacterium]